jgi:hypothetical protein
MLNLKIYVWDPKSFSRCRQKDPIVSAKKSIAVYIFLGILGTKFLFLGVFYISFSWLYPG